MTFVDSRSQQAIQTIFITTDNAGDRSEFSTAFRTLNPSLRVEVQANSSELFSLLNFIQPDLLFLGMDLYRKSCLECILEIRRNKRLAGLPIVVFDDSARPSNIEASYEMGADLFFVRPQQLERLVELLGILLGLDWSRPQQVKEAFSDRGQSGALGH